MSIFMHNVFLHSKNLVNTITISEKPVWISWKSSKIARWMKEHNAGEQLTWNAYQSNYSMILERELTVLSELDICPPEDVDWNPH